MSIAPAPESTAPAHPVTQPLSAVPRPPVLPADAWTRLAAHVDVWLLPAASTPSPQSLKALANLLSTDEQARAHRFRFAQHAAAFTLARAQLRMLLGAYLDRDPETLRFVYGPQGKPALACAEGAAAHPTRAAGLEFNLSHTDGLTVIALTRSRRVGIDVERTRPAADLLDLAAQNFSPSEVVALQALEHPQRLKDAFYHCWTAKEAFLKAQGEGLTRPLAGFSVSVDPKTPSALLDCQWEPDAPSRWLLHRLPTSPGFASTLACERLELPPHDAVSTFTWTLD